MGLCHLIAKYGSHKAWAPKVCYFDVSFLWSQRDIALSLCTLLITSDAVSESLQTPKEVLLALRKYFSPLSKTRSLLAQALLSVKPVLTQK